MPAKEHSFTGALTLLVSSAGRRQGLIECFRKAAQSLNENIRIIAVDMDPSMSVACQLADQTYAVPACTSENFIPQVLEICKSEKVDILIPTIDPELEIFSNAKGLFSEIGTEVIVSGTDTIHLARDKEQFACFLKSSGLPAPKTVSADKFQECQDQFLGRIILKPRSGSRSIGMKRYSESTAIPERELTAENIIQECWEGEEYTVNVYVGSEDRLCVVPHLRHEVRAGEVSKGITRRLPEVTEAAKKLTQQLGDAKGPLCFQIIRKSNGDFVIFELNARFGGGYPLADAAGATFAKWILEERLGLPSTVSDEWEDGLTMLRYDAAVFVKTT